MYERTPTEISTETVARRTAAEEAAVLQAQQVEEARVAHEMARRRYTLTRITQLIWLAEGVLEAAIAIRIVLKLIAANPDSGFASFIYSMTGLFLAPFVGLTGTPAAGGSVLEIPSLIAMIVYALLAWGIVRLIWVVFDVRPVPKL